MAGSARIAEGRVVSLPVIIRPAAEADIRETHESFELYLTRSRLRRFP